MHTRKPAPAALVDERNREAGPLAAMKAGTCFSGHPRPEDRDGGRAHPVHGRTARDRGRQRACDPVADHPDGLLLRPSRYCVDCRGFVAVTAAFCTVQMAMQRRAIDLLSIVCVRDLT